MNDCIPSRPIKKYPSTTVKYVIRNQRYHVGRGDESVKDGVDGGDEKEQ